VHRTRRIIGLHCSALLFSRPLTAPLTILLAAHVPPAAAGSYADFFRFVELDRPEPVARLLQAGFDLNARDERGQHALYLALRSDSLRVCSLLLGWPGLDVEATNSAGETLLMMAALKHRIDAMQRLLALGAAVNRRGWTPLHYAASGGSEQAIELLLLRGAQIDARAPNGNTALMMAAAYGTIDGAELLIRRGADVRLLDDAGLSAADKARAAGFDGLAQKLTDLAATPPPGTH